MEIAPKSVESIFASLAKAPPIVWVVLGLLLMNLFGAMPFWGVIVGVVFSGLLFNRMQREQEIAKAKAAAASFANCIGPIVVGSQHPGETVVDVHSRAEFWREQLRLSGNPYAEIIPIIEYPYTPLLLDYGQLPAGWSIYSRLVGEKQHMADLEWYNGKCPQALKSLFASAVLPAPKQQEQ